jgi:regulation of enolase protein 1 (concanavalin A-like superfamily)
MTSKWKAVHLEHDIPDLSGSFKITTSPGTDVWDKPPSTHSFNAPIIYQSTSVGSFRSAKVSVSATWKDQYDQGGLAIVVKSADGTHWIKTGIEFYDGQSNVSTVAKDRWSDWSLRPLLAEADNNAVVEIDLADDGSLWVWLVGSDGKRSPLREVTWWKTLDKKDECWVGIYVAKPAPNGEKDKLTVDFEGLVVETS